VATNANSLAPRIAHLVIKFAKQNALTLNVQRNVESSAYSVKNHALTNAFILNALSFVQSHAIESLAMRDVKNCFNVSTLV
jgi:hypothetical protein